MSSVCILQKVRNTDAGVRCCDTDATMFAIQSLNSSLYCDGTGYLHVYLCNYWEQNGTSIDKVSLSKMSYKLAVDVALLKLKRICKKWGNIYKVLNLAPVLDFFLFLWENNMTTRKFRDKGVCFILQLSGHTPSLREVRDGAQGKNEAESLRDAMNLFASLDHLPRGGTTHS